MIESLDVYMWNNKVGTLVSNKQGYREQIIFYFDPAFIKGEWDISPLRASIKSVAAKNGFPVFPDDDKIFAGLPSFIADSLPDRWGATVFREWAAKEKISLRKLSSLDRLAYIGRRGMGALEFLPPMAGKLEEPFKVEIESLYKVAEKTLEDSKNLHFKLSPDLQIESLLKVGTSAGGKRPKAILNIDFDTMECYSGQVAAPQNGFTPVIIKFEESGNFPSTKVEYSYYLMARAAGIRMTQSRLMEVAGHTHFVTERFDRIGADKLHVQTLAAMAPYSSSYEDLFEVAEKLGLSSDEKSQMFLSMVMNVVCGNVDDHNKNFSFLMDKSGKWSFAPVYDFTFAIDHKAPDYVNIHSLTVNGKNRSINRNDLLRIAKLYNVADASSLIDRAVNVAANYPTYGAEAGVGQEWIEIIMENQTRF